MDTKPVVAIGPVSPPITGPGLKNKYIKQGLEAQGVEVTWINTLERSPETVTSLLRQSWDAERFLVSASTKVRFGTALVLSGNLADPAVDSALLPAGGSFATELKHLPPGLRGLYLNLFSRFDCVLPQSDELSRELRRLLDSDVLVSTLPNLRPVPDDPPTFDQFKGADRPLRLTYVGRIKETKGLHQLLAAINEINRTENRVELDVFGHFLDGDEYENRFRELCEFTPGARFLGKLDNGDVIQRLRGYDVFAFPTYYPGEGFPGVLVEAFAAGCLILASDWNYNSQLVSDGHDGLLFEPKSSRSIRERIEWLLDNPASVDSYKRRSWENANNYSIETVTGKLTTYLEQSGW
jgi:glycosyltransferase involved in cell wall biosynthesis